MTILAGFPYGKDDRSGIEFATTLARSSGQDLVVVTVVPAPWPTPAAANTDREFRQWAAEQGAAAVAEAEALLAEHAGEVRSRAMWVTGRSVPATLVDQATALDASMIVIGSNGDGAYGHVQLGSTGDRLMHSSRVPVAVATRGYFASAQGRITRVTCAFRGDDASHRTVERTAVICREVGAGLRIATFAVRGRTMYPPEVGTQAEDMVLDRWISQAGAAQQKALTSLRAAEQAPPVSEAVVARGRTWATAMDQLGWERDEVFVVGSSTAGFIERIFLGSNAAKLVRHAPVPVVVVP